MKQHIGEKQHTENRINYIIFSQKEKENIATALLVLAKQLRQTANARFLLILMCFNNRMEWQVFFCNAINSCVYFAYLLSIQG